MSVGDRCVPTALAYVVWPVVPSVGGGMVTVTYKCPVCERMWEDVRPEKKLTAIN